MSEKYLILGMTDDNCAFCKALHEIGELPDSEVSMWMFRGTHICYSKSFSILLS